MFIDEVALDPNLKKIPLTSAQQHQALVWSLDETQEIRYVLLVQNRSGLYYRKTSFAVRHGRPRAEANSPR